MTGRRELRAMSTRELRERVVALEALLEDQMRAGVGVGEAIEVDAIVRLGDRQPAVHLRSGEAAWEWTPSQARMFALFLLNAATEAERDAATIAFLDAADFTPEQASGFLVAMREHRVEWLAKLTDGSFVVKDD